MDSREQLITSPCFIYTLCTFNECPLIVIYMYCISSNTSRPRIVPTSVCSLALNEINSTLEQYPHCVRTTFIAFASNEELKDNKTAVDDEE